MTCFYPSIRLGIKQADGKSKTKRIIYNTEADFEYWNQRKKTLEGIDESLEIQKIPCGHCLGCREKQAIQWAERCMLEAQKYKSNIFLTLTYDEEHKPVKEEFILKKPPILIKGDEFHEDDYDPNEDKIINNDSIYRPNGYKKDGVEHKYNEPKNWNGTLEKEDLQKFMRSLRDHYRYHYKQSGIRFFSCGEYGTESGRPHYHAIIFNIDVPDKYFVGLNHKNQPVYSSQIIEGIWEKGFITIGDVNWESCAYVAGYVSKKLVSDRGFGQTRIEKYAMNGQIPEFVNTSRRPGIGREYFEQHKEEIYKNDEIIIGKKKRMPPKYFDKLFELEDPEAMKLIKQKRQEAAEEAAKLKATKTTLTEQQQREVEWNKQIEKKGSFRRELVEY